MPAELVPIMKGKNGSSSRVPETAVIQVRCQNSEHWTQI